MLIKCSQKEENKKINPFFGVLLLFISLFLFIISAPFGLIFGIIYKLCLKSLSGIGELSLKIAISIDQLGNVVMQDLFNVLLIINGGHKFGNRDETISSVIGKNLQKNKLTKLGESLNNLLSLIDVNHSLNSIDYYIEPIEDSTKK